jgi:hypothetical protein
MQIGFLVGVLTSLFDSVPPPPALPRWAATLKFVDRVTQNRLEWGTEPSLPVEETAGPSTALGMTKFRFVLSLAVEFWMEELLLRALRTALSIPLADSCWKRRPKPCHPERSERTCIAPRLPHKGLRSVSSATESSS